jgi:hypothetical protein
LDNAPAWLTETVSHAGALSQGRGKTELFACFFLWHPPQKIQGTHEALKDLKTVATKADQ